MSGDLWLWTALAAAVPLLLAFDLLVLHRTPREVTMREALVLSVAWTALGLAFAVPLWLVQGPEAAGAYTAGYLIERSLSVDNVFVFAAIFASLAVPPLLQYRILTWGIVLAIVLRAVFIVVGAALLATFHWVLYVFGAFLVLTGVKIARHAGEEKHPERGLAMRLFRRLVPTTDGFRGDRLLVRERGRLLATPLLAALALVAVFDLVFAVDSIPAIFAVTDDALIVLAANAFALLGLRALFFLVTGAMRRLAYLDVGLGAILVLIGGKMLVSDVWKVPVWASLVGIVAILGVAAAASLLRPPARAEGGPALPAREAA
jgi:tellurite resistance protein TerC